MAEPTENTRLASRLLEIGAALARPAATNGHAEVVATSLSDELIDAWAAGTVPFIRECITDALAARDAVWEQRFAELQAEVTELRQRPTMRYEGVWDAETMYAIGDFATHGGSIWHCERACTGVRPGTREDVWMLSVKHGRDGKVDLRPIEQRLAALERKVGR